MAELPLSLSDITRAISLVGRSLCAKIAELEIPILHTCGATCLAEMCKTAFSMNVAGNVAQDGGTVAGGVVLLLHAGYNYLCARSAAKSAPTAQPQP
jgi:hypothetical protein